MMSSENKVVSRKHASFFRLISIILPCSVAKYTSSVATDLVLTILVRIQIKLTESLELVALGDARVLVVLVLRDADLVHDNPVVVDLTQRIRLLQVVPADLVV